MNWPALIACSIAISVAACSSAPTLPPTVSTRTVEVKVPVPVPCFTEADRPKLPPPTALVDNATAEQKAAAVVADAEALARYAEAVDALFLKCVKTGEKL